MEVKKSTVSDSLVKTWVEPGKFFREKMLKEGVVMPMPDIRDKLRKRSFLPRSILAKLPFSTSKIDEMKGLFNASDNGLMEKMMRDSLGECERVPARGETKKCVGSIEDMIDFATLSKIKRHCNILSCRNPKTNLEENQYIAHSRAQDQGGKIYIEILIFNTIG